MGTPRCTICSNPQVEVINAAILARSQRYVAKTMNLSVASLKRHVAHGHMDVMREASALPPVDPSLPVGSLRERLEAQMTRLELAAAVPGLAHRSFLETVTAMRLLAVELEKLPALPCPEPDLVGSEQWLALRELIYSTLHRHPAALADLEAALAGANAGEVQH